MSLRAVRVPSISFFSSSFTEYISIPIGAGLRLPVAMTNPEARALLVGGAGQGQATAREVTAAKHAARGGSLVALDCPPVFRKTCRCPGHSFA
jgi:hypothetical protein